MFSIDKFAYISGLKNVNPLEKFIFAISTMVVCISLNNIIDSVIILLLMTIITVFKGKIPLKTYIKLMSIPLAFLVVGILTIAINVVENNNNLIVSFSIFNIKLGCTYRLLQFHVYISLPLRLLFLKSYQYLKS